jgi:hypothetical protein
MNLCRSSFELKCSSCAYSLFRLSSATKPVFICNAVAQVYEVYPSNLQQQLHVRRLQEVARSCCPCLLLYDGFVHVLFASGTTVTIDCPEGLHLNLNSRHGKPVVESGAELALVGCDVTTVATRALASQGPPLWDYMESYLSTSDGTVRFENSRLLVPSEVSCSPCFLEHPSRRFSHVRELMGGCQRVSEHITSYARSPSQIFTPSSPVAFDVAR